VFGNQFILKEKLDGKLKPNSRTRRHEARAFDWLRLKLVKATIC
jgi:hypothetical protein